MRFESLKNELSLEKQKLIEKYSLVCCDDLMWRFNHKKYDTIDYFSHKFAKKHSVLSLVFHINRLCYAKIKYFEKNFSKYEPYKYDFSNGFCKCETYDLEFLLHKPSNNMIDLRNLSSIKSIEEFKEFCKLLESYEYTK